MSASAVTPASAAVSARARRFAATSAKPLATFAFAASGSSGLGSPGGTRGAACASTTGPTAPPRPTPIPVKVRPCAVVVGAPSSAGISALRLGVEVGREQLDELVEHPLGLVPLGREGDLLAVFDAERHDAQHARGVDGRAAVLRDRHGHTA